MSITSAAPPACFAISSRSRSGKACRCRRTNPRKSCARSPIARARSGEPCSPSIARSFGDVELAVHHPPRPDWERQRVRNDDSEVIEIRHGGCRSSSAATSAGKSRRTIAPSFDRAPIRDPESSPPRERHIELARFLTRSGPTSRSSAPAEAIRSDTRRRRSSNGTGNWSGDLPHRPRWSRNGGDRWHDGTVKTFTGTESDADHDDTDDDEPRRGTNNERDEHEGAQRR